MTTPMSSYDYDMSKRSKTLVKRDEVLGGFDPANYVTERLHATAADGIEGPDLDRLSQGVQRRTAARPLLLYGYGSYGRAWTRRSRRNGSACSTAGSPMRSPTSGAARNWAATGTRAASSSRRTEHLHRFHRLCALHLIRGGIHQARPPLRPGRRAPGAC